MDCAIPGHHNNETPRGCGVELQRMLDVVERLLIPCKSTWFRSLMPKAPLNTELQLSQIMTTDWPSRQGVFRRLTFMDI